jgi:hypothetical protein
VAVRIAQADGDDAEARCRRRQEIRKLFCAAVVRHLQHVGLEVLLAVLQQDLLDRRLDVTCQQDVERRAAHVHRDGHDDGVVVGAGVLARTVLGHVAHATAAAPATATAARVGRRMQWVLGLRPQDSPGDVPDLALFVGLHAHDGDSRGRGEAVDQGGSGRRVIDGRRLDFAYLAALEQAGESVDVVGMEVGEDRERDVGDT